MTTMYLTEQDVQDYGSELINLTQRSALHAVAPALQNLEHQNVELQRRLAQETRHRLDQQVERALPDLHERDRDPRWHHWLRGVDVLSGLVRQQLLNDAIASGSAERVVAFFRSFQREAGDTQQSSPTRGQAAGRRSSGKPIYTRDQIRELYVQHRKGEIAEDQWNRIEADIFAAQKENRISMSDYITK